MHQRGQYVIAIFLALTGMEAERQRSTVDPGDITAEYLFKDRIQGKEFGEFTKK